MDQPGNCPNSRSGLKCVGKRTYRPSNDIHGNATSWPPAGLQAQWPGWIRDQWFKERTLHFRGRRGSVLKVAEEKYYRGEQCVGTSRGQDHYKGAWGRCGSLSPLRCLSSNSIQQVFIEHDTPHLPWPSLCKNTQICSSCRVSFIALELETWGAYFLKRQAHDFQDGTEGTKEIWEN